MRGLLLLFSGVVIGVTVGVTAAQSDWGFAVRAGPAAPAGTLVQWVDRTHKGDRLDLSVTRVGKEPAPARKLMDGCEAAASPLSPSAQNPARCAA